MMSPEKRTDDVRERRQVPDLREKALAARSGKTSSKSRVAKNIFTTETQKRSGDLVIGSSGECTKSQAASSKKGLLTAKDAEKNISTERSAKTRTESRK